MAVAFAIVGTLRCAALFANGKLPVYGAIARYCGSFAGAIAWAMLTTPLAIDSIVSQKASFTMPLFGMVALDELISVYRAVRDGGYKRA